MYEGENSDEVLSVRKLSIMIHCLFFYHVSRSHKGDILSEVKTYWKMGRYHACRIKIIATLAII